LLEILHYCKTVKYTLYHQVYLNISQNYKIMLSQPRQPPLLSVRLAANELSLGFS